MTMLTEHFSLEEASTTSHRSLDNTIPPELEAAVKNTAKKMERVRALLDDKGIHINSWYRSPEVNAAVGGSKTSQHMKGEAVDFICPRFGTPLDIVKKLSNFPELLKYDQIILEHTWVHISFPSDPNAIPRNQVLTLLNNKHYAIGITDKLGNPI